MVSLHVGIWMEQNILTVPNSAMHYPEYTAHSGNNSIIAISVIVRLNVKFEKQHYSIMSLRNAYKTTDVF